uniref:virulence factor SrfC family protein n=1 Tax=Roseobacter litoralis TaxID=42443 RepID=UPI0024951623
GAASPPRPGGASRPSRPGRPNRPGKPAPVAVEVDTDATAKTALLIRTMSSEDFQANTAIDIWIEHLSQLREDADRLATFSLTPEAAADLVRELVHGFRRTDVASDMKTLLKAIDYGLTVDKQAPPAAIVCAETINSFVHSLGAEKLSDKDRPVIGLQDGNSRMAFEARPASDTAFDLPQEQRAAAEDFWTDWVYMLEALFVGNAKDGDAGEINIEQNMAIGRVVNGLDAEQTA